MKLMEHLIVREEFDHWGLLVDPDSGMTQALNPSALMICRMLEKETDRERLLARLRQSFDGAGEQLETDVDHFLDKLRMLGVLEK